eukprot:6181527-Prymnesium_polylepis.1
MAHSHGKRDECGLWTSRHHTGARTRLKNMLKKAQSQARRVSPRRDITHQVRLTTSRKATQRAAHTLARRGSSSVVARATCVLAAVCAPSRSGAARAFAALGSLHHSIPQRSPGRLEPKAADAEAADDEGRT